MPPSRRARATTFAPRSWPSRPGLATTTRIRELISVRPFSLPERVFRSETYPGTGTRESRTSVELRIYAITQCQYRTTRDGLWCSGPIRYRVVQCPARSPGARRIDGHETRSPRLRRVPIPVAQAHSPGAGRSTGGGLCVPKQQEPGKYRGRRRLPKLPGARYFGVVLTAVVGAAIVALGAGAVLPDGNHSGLGSQLSMSVEDRLSAVDKANRSVDRPQAGLGRPGRARPVAAAAALQLRDHHALRDAVGRVPLRS